MERFGSLTVSTLCWRYGRPRRGLAGRDPELRVGAPAPGSGANAGVSVGAGLVERDIEGLGLGVDTSIGAGSVAPMFDQEGFNGVFIGKGPGVGLSASITDTKTLTLRSVIEWKPQPGTEYPMNAP